MGAARKNRRARWCGKASAWVALCLGEREGIGIVVVGEQPETYLEKCLSLEEAGARELYWMAQVEPDVPWEHPVVFRTDSPELAHQLPGGSGPDLREVLARMQGLVFVPRGSGDRFADRACELARAGAQGRRPDPNTRPQLGT